MKKWFKRGLFTVVTALIVALVGGAVFLLTLDPNAYKQRLERLVYEHYHRTLSIEGNIELSLFPRIGLAVENVSLSEQNSRQPFAAIESARVAVAVWPLLWNHWVVDHVAIDGFEIWLNKDEHNGFTFTDLLHRSNPSLPFQIDIAGLELKDGAIYFLDQEQQPQWQLADLSITTGRVTFDQPFDVIFKGQLHGQVPHAKAKVLGQSVLRIEPHQRNYKALRTTVSITGQWQHQAWQLNKAELRFSAAELNVQHSAQAPSLVAKKLKLRAQAQLAGRISPLEGVGEAELELSTGARSTVLTPEAVDGRLAVRLMQGHLLGWDIPVQFIDGEALPGAIPFDVTRYTAFELLDMDWRLSQGQAELQKLHVKAPRFRLQSPANTADASINIVDQQLNLKVQGHWYPVSNTVLEQPFELLLKGPWRDGRIRAQSQP